MFADKWGPLIGATISSLQTKKKNMWIKKKKVNWLMQSVLKNEKYFFFLLIYTSWRKLQNRFVCLEE
jgi:hypothetical protein